YPKAAEIAFLATPAHERVLQRGVDRFLGGTIQLALVGEIALRQAEKLLSCGQTNGSPFHARHLLLLTLTMQNATLHCAFYISISLLVRQHSCELRGVDIRHRRRPAQGALPLGRVGAR